MVTNIGKPSGILTSGVSPQSFNLILGLNPDHSSLVKHLKNNTSFDHLAIDHCKSDILAYIHHPWGVLP